MNFINKTHLSPAKHFLLDLVFPRYCLGCEQEIESKQTSQICDVCFGKIILNRGVQYQEKTAIKAVFAAGRYEDPILRIMILAFKYQSMESLKIPLAELIISYLTKELLTDKLANFVLVPIPLTLKRKLARGFNQSELLANEIGKFLNCPVINLLKRTKFNTPQVEIPDWRKRKENISGVFCLSPGVGFGSPTSGIFEVGLRKLGDSKSLPGKILLIDDVSTSGATLEEAAAILKQAGAKEIYGLVAAKG